MRVPWPLTEVVYHLWCRWTQHRGFNWHQTTIQKEGISLTFATCAGCSRVDDKDVETAFLLMIHDLAKRKAER